MKIKTLLLLMIWTAIAYCQDVVVDPNFGNDGFIITDYTNTDDIIADILVLPDGRIIAVGVSSKDNQFRNIVLACYLENGDLDPSFGNQGKVITDFGNSNEYASSVHLLPDGRILVTGGTNDVGTDHNFTLVQYLPDGNLDLTFGNGGKVITDFFGEDDLATSSELLDDGKILVAGSIRSSNGDDRDFGLARYMSNGDIDISFGINGRVNTDVSDFFDACYDMSIQLDGKILLAGVATGNGIGNFALVRYHPNGDLDTDFGVNGKTLTSFGIGSQIAFSVLALSNGKILVSGSSVSPLRNYPDFAMARYLPDGTWDTDFGNNGVVLTNFDNRWSDSRAMTLVDGNKILLSGTIGTNTDSGLARYHENGQLDISFGIDGKVITDVQHGEIIYDVDIQPDGKIVIGGAAYTNSDKGFDFLIIRYLAPLPTGIEKTPTSIQNLNLYPNPVKEYSSLEYSLDTNSEITIAIYDFSGHLIQTFISNEKRRKGMHKEHLIVDPNIQESTYLLKISNERYEVETIIFNINS